MNFSVMIGRHITCYFKINEFNLLPNTKRTRSAVLKMSLHFIKKITTSYLYFICDIYFRWLSLDLNRQVKYIPNTLEPEWQQTVVFMNCLKRTLKKRVLEVTVWDFDRLKMNDFMGQTTIHLGGKMCLRYLIAA